MVRRKDFDALQYAMAEKSHLLGPVFVNSPRLPRSRRRREGRGEPDDKVACLLENGNVWWYPVKDVKRALWSELPRSNRRAYLRRKGYKTL